MREANGEVTMGNLSKWKCFHCGNDVIEGQRFTFIPGKGAIHVECLNELILKSPSRDVVAIADANEILLYTIIRLKEAERVAETPEVKDRITRIRKEIERLAGDVVKMMPAT